MSANNALRDLMDRLIVCDEQPSEACLMEVQKSLKHKVMNMDRKGRISLYLFIAGIFGMALGFAVLLASDDGHQSVTWLLWTGFIALITGAITIVIGAVGLFVFRGFSYVWARHDLNDAAIMELSLQVQQLSLRLDALDKTPPQSPEPSL